MHLHLRLYIDKISKVRHSTNQQTDDISASAFA